MLSFIPLLCFLLIILVLLKYQLFDNLRSAFMAATLLWGLWVTAITEGLSIFQAIEKRTILIVWVVFVIIGASLCIFPLSRKIKITKYLNRNVLKTSSFELSLLIPIAAIIILIGSIAWFAPPNNYDSMTYHLSRVFHWIQNRSVSHYPTHIIFQLHQNPWSEFAALQFMILGGNDKLTNFIQWFSMAGSVLGITLITKQLGGNFRAQIFAAVSCVTLPMGILQGSSTQTDYVASYWLVCLAYFALVFRENMNIKYALALGISLGLAVLTKATSYIYAFPFILWLSVSVIRTGRIRKLLLLAIVLSSAFIVNLGHYSRNYNLYRNPLGPMADFNTSYTNELISFPSVVSNISRNIALHIGTPIDGLNAFFEAGILKMHELIRFSPNDPRTTWPGTGFHINSFIFHEDHAGNPVHLFLIVISFILLIFQRAHNEERLLSLLLLIGFIMFCILLKWQPWNSRLHLPFFVLWSPLTGIMLSRLKVDTIANIFIIFLLIYIIPWVLQNPSRPLLGDQNVFIVDRVDQYFSLHQQLKEPYIASVNYVKQTPCVDYGLIVGENDLEYPFWVLLKDSIGPEFRLEHVNVTNVSRVLSDEFPYVSFSPCALLVTRVDQPDTIIVRGVTFHRKWLLSPVSVYVKVE